MRSLQMGKCELDEKTWIEEAEVLTSFDRTKQLLDTAKHRKEAVKERLAGWYLRTPKPHPADIFNIRVGRRGGWTSIRFSIRRGQNVLGGFLRAHPHSVLGHTPDQIRLVCPHCENQLDVPLESIGQYPRVRFPNCVEA